MVYKIPLYVPYHICKVHWSLDKVQEGPGAKHAAAAWDELRHPWPCQLEPAARGDSESLQSYISGLSISYTGYEFEAFQ